ncbi:MAG: hypothetical protein WC586_03540 [Methanoregula sp.]
MLPTPEQEEPLTPAGCDDLPWFTLTWQNLPWTPWVPFSATKTEFRTVPNEPGLYRIRPAGKDFLVYISETNRTLHQRLNELRLNLKRDDLMPWNDPDTSAPMLWALRDAEGYEYECSAAPLDASSAGRRGMENFLLYRYRQETGDTPACNFGRFHPRYRRSTIKSGNLRGAKLKETDRDNPAGGPSYPPLCATGLPGEQGWMGIPWSRTSPLDAEIAGTVPAAPGLYLLFDEESGEITSIGQSMDLQKRLAAEAGKDREGVKTEFSYHIVQGPVLPHNLRELECDLLGNFFEQFKKAPALQFRHGN